MTKKVVKKSPPKRAPRVVKDAELDSDANTDAIASKDASKGSKPKIHAKSVSIIVSIGSKDRNRNIDELREEIFKRLKAVPYGQDGLHATATGGYYILDGKVCMPDDYDEKTQNFKPGTTPPPWAGGVSQSQTKKTSQQQQIEADFKNLSKKEYNEKYGLDKRKSGGYQKGTITPADQKKLLEDHKARKVAAEDDEVEDIDDFDWEPEDVLDDSKFKKSSKKSVDQATKKLAGGKKRVVKKPKVEKPAKKVVRRVKK